MNQICSFTFSRCNVLPTHKTEDSKEFLNSAKALSSSILYVSLLLFDFKVFYKIYESISESGENDGVHIRGSECDQKILSKKESTGHVYSPNYPFPYVPKVVCRFVLKIR